MTFYVFLIGWAIVKTISLNRQFRRRREQSDKKWMLEDIIFSQAKGLNLVFISQLYSVVKFSEHLAENQLWVILFSALFTATMLFFHISYHILPGKADQLLKTTYPEYTL